MILKVKRLFCNKYTAAIAHNETAAQAARYFVVGGCCTVFDFAMLFCFTHFLHINYLLSAVISFTISAVVNYLLCIAWVFDVRVVEKRHQEFMYYLLLSILGLGLSTLLIWIFTAWVGLYYMISKLIATFITYWINFGSRKYLLHTRK